MIKVVLTNPDQLEKELEGLDLADKMDLFFDKVAMQCQVLTLRHGENFHTNVDVRLQDDAVHTLMASFNRVEDDQAPEEDAEAITIRFNHLLPYG